MTSNARAQRLLDEFEEGAAFAGGHSIRHGLAAVLRHLIATEADPESWGAVPANRLEALADALDVPFTDKQGQWLPQYQPLTDDTDD